MKLLDLPAQAGRFLHGLGVGVRGVVGDDIIRALGGKRQAEQFELMALWEVSQVHLLACKLIPGLSGSELSKRTSGVRGARPAAGSGLFQSD